MLNIFSHKQILFCKFFFKLIELFLHLLLRLFEVSLLLSQCYLVCFNLVIIRLLPVLRRCTYLGNHLHYMHDLILQTMEFFFKLFNLSLKVLDCLFLVFDYQMKFFFVCLLLLEITGTSS